MQSPFVSFCTDSGSRATDGPLAGSKSHPRGWGSYPRILGRYVRDEKLLSLEAAIQAYGLIHFKLKIAGDVERDAERLRRIFAVIERNARGSEWGFTIRPRNKNLLAVQAVYLVKELGRTKVGLLCVSQPSGEW